MQLKVQDQLLVVRKTINHLFIYLLTRIKISAKKQPMPEKISKTAMKRRKTVSYQPYDEDDSENNDDQPGKDQSISCQSTRINKHMNNFSFSLKNFSQDTACP